MTGTSGKPQQWAKKFENGKIYAIYEGSFTGNTIPSSECVDVFARGYVLV